MYFSKKKKKIEITDYLKQYQFSIPSCIPTFLTVVAVMQKSRMVRVSECCQVQTVWSVELTWSRSMLQRDHNTRSVELKLVPSRVLLIVKTQGNHWK